MELAITFLLVTTRLIAVAMTAPLLGSRVLGMRMRLGIALAVAVLAFPLVEFSSVPTESAEVGSALFSEALIGALLGFGVTILFSAAQMVGEVIAQLAGIQIADQIDPNSGSATSAVGQLFAVLSLAVFALVNGPEMVVTSVLDTFVSLPPGTPIRTGSMLELVPQLLQQSFVLTLRGVAPAVAALMISTMVIGLIGRTYPQMNLLQFGLSLNLVVMLLAIILTLGGCMWLFVDNWQEAIDFIETGLAPSAVK